MRSAIASNIEAALPKASLLDTFSVFTDVILPTVAKGVIIRRPKVVALAERLELDRRAVRRMQHLRNRYGAGSLMLPLGARRQALILSSERVHRVLENSPEPFATATTEKRKALSHFQPKGALISHGVERADRRRFNEAVLDSDRSMRRLAERFVAVVGEEAEYILAKSILRRELGWDEFADGWFRLVRRVVFGDDPRDDHELTNLIAQLRSDANWAFLKPQRKRLRNQFVEQLNRRLDQADLGSLAGVMAATPTTHLTEPSQQVPQWLFAFDPAGMTTFRALALLASHPEHAERVREEIKDHRGSPPQELPYLRACVLESLRLWPTVPLLLRQTTEETMWDAGVMSPDAGIIIFTQFFRRDDQRLPYADSLSPELWLKERTTQDWPLVPFSERPAVCPGRNLVLLLSRAMLARLLDDRQARLKPPDRLDVRRPLPYTLNHYSLRFELNLLCRSVADSFSAAPDSRRWPVPGLSDATLTRTRRHYGLTQMSGAACASSSLSRPITFTSALCTSLRIRSRCATRLKSIAAGSTRSRLSI